VDAVEGLAAAGGAALVSAMTTDMWTMVKPRMLALLGRHSPDADLVERSEAALRHLDGPSLVDAQARYQEIWQVRLRALLDEQPAATGELRDLIAAIRISTVPDPDVDIAPADGIVNAVQGGSLNQYQNGTAG
jgi:hypothetical protein